MIVRRARAHARHDDQIISAHDLPLMQAIDLPQAAADAIAHNSMADLVGHGVADAAAARMVFPAVDHQIGVGAAFPLRVQTPEFIVLFECAGKFQKSPPILSDAASGQMPLGRKVPALKNIIKKSACSRATTQ